MLRGEITLLYAAPERVTTPRFLAQLDSLHERGQLSLFAIDEAHCVSQWGHDFRPEYRALTVLHERYGSVPRIALTATADAITRADIVERLQLERGAPVRQQLRPAQHPLHHRREEGRDRPAAALHRERARGRGRHRLLPVAQARGGHRADPVRAGCRRPALPRRPGRRGAAGQPGPLPARRRRGDGGDHRLRHGHRQARRALRGAPGHAQEHRGLLPGDRPRRPRRPGRRGLDGLRPAGRGEPAPHDRREPGRRGLQAGDARQARRAAGAGRGHRLPAGAAARLLRRSSDAVRQLRQLPAAAAVWDGTDAARKLLSTHLPRAAGQRHQLRRRPHHGHPARQEDREGGAVRPRAA